MTFRTQTFSNLVTSILCLVASGLLVPIASAQMPPASVLAKPLFDGSSLAGWEGDAAYWRVERGSIIGEIPVGLTLNHNTWLVWRGGELTDFDLSLQFKLSGKPAANSGIQYRCQVENINHVAGYQADLDMGATWLGRIYDEHGRALLVERGSRVSIDEDGTRLVDELVPANQFAVLFRESDWNEYRIVAIGDHVAVYVNGTLFSELQDRQQGARDLSGSLALQLHSGPETRIEFRDVRLESLQSTDQRLRPLVMKSQQSKPVADPDVGVLPRSVDDVVVDTDFESGTLQGWTATGNAFKGQPVNRDGIPARWSQQSSNKHGDYFIGGWEIVNDAGTGALTSPAFVVTHPYASFLFAGGSSPSTRIELFRTATGSEKETILFTATGNQREQMDRVGVDLREYQGQSIALRLVDESSGPWGHLNFDDFRLCEQLPVNTRTATEWRSIRNPLLQHLVPNVVAKSPSGSASPGTETISQMFVLPGFSVDVVAAEPDLHQPMAFTFDAKGRLWVVEGHSYPQKRPEGEGLDRILIFSDNDGDGSFEHRQVFTEGLNLVSGLAVGHGGVWVGAAPELLFIADRDGDDRPDAPPQVMLDGFGFADTHETMNSFLWGPDGWLYGNQGVFNTSMIGMPGANESDRTHLSAGVWRYHPTRHVFEVFAHGGSNQWGLDYDDFGQLFMTHCRSFWGKGPTTHVIQGGHYWNQVNSGHASFVSPTAPAKMPAMQNFMLASARYGHGEGGAGKPGSQEVYGGHSHVGTMIYLGDNWPAQYRNRLFTHNLHGHQINQQINLRELGGYNTVHAGFDALFCSDRQYIGVDLKVGPDGAVYISDWYDPRHCHSPNTEQWDRGNGRMYRMKYDAGYKSVKVDYTTASDAHLVAAQLHHNDWHVRTARLVLSERAADGDISANVIKLLVGMATIHPEPSRRLRAVWALHAVHAMDGKLAERLLTDDSEYVRAWTVQLAVESLPQDEVAPILERLVARESSLLVRRYLASAIPRVAPSCGWNLAVALSKQQENAADRELPLLLWYGVAGLMQSDLDRALQLADETAVTTLRDNVQWYAVKLSAAGRDAVAGRLAQAYKQNAGGEETSRLLALFALGVEGMRGIPQPQGWSDLARGLYDSPAAELRRITESLGAVFGDAELLSRARQRLANESSSLKTKQQALSILAGDASMKNLPIFVSLLDVPELAEQVVPLLSRYNDPVVAQQLVARLPSWQGAESDRAMEVMCRRSSSAKQILDAVRAGDLPKNRVTAYYARQMSNLGDAELNERLANEWGQLGQTSGQRAAELQGLTSAYKQAPLWAYDASAGAEHFKKLCANCHNPDAEGLRLAPQLSGSGAKGIDYIVENVIDPNAVIGADFQARLVLTTEGRVVSGLIEKETDSAITIRTANGRETISREDVEQVSVSKHSFMPENLLQTLNDREQIELLKYLMSL